MRNLNTLNKQEKIEAVKGAIKHFAPFVLVTVGLWSIGDILKIETRGFWFVTGLISCLFMLRKIKE